MKFLVVIAALTWSNWQGVEGTMEVQESTRSFFPGPFFPPYPPTFSPGVFPPFNPPPECFPQPVIQEFPVPEPTVCPVCPVEEPCICEPVVQTCQTYTITVCPSAPVQVAEPAPVMQEVIDEKIIIAETGQVLSEKQEVVDVTPEFVTNPAMFGPVGGFTPYPAYNHLIGGIYPQYGGFPSSYGTTTDTLSALRSLGDERQEKSESKEKVKKER